MVEWAEINNLNITGNIKLTLKDLQAMSAHEIFAKGEFVDGIGGCNIQDTNKMIPWIAKRGEIHDWAIYYQNPSYVDTRDTEIIVLGMAGKWNAEKIAQQGDKLRTKSNIKKLVDCDDEAFAVYRK